MPISLPSLGGSSSSSPAFRPAFKITQGAGGGADGGLMGAVSSLLGATQADPWAECVQSLQFDMQLAPGVDTCTVEASSSLPSVALGDSLSVQLGYADQLSPVYSGKIARILARQDGSVQLTLDNGALTLARLRQNTSFEQQTLSGVVNTLLSDAGITPGTIDTGVNFPFLAIDDRQSLWQWISTLAAYSACHAWVDNAGSVHVKAGGGPATASFSYGNDILSLHHSQATPQAGKITVIGEGAAGSQGSQAWSWLSKKTSGISAQQGSSGGQHQQSQRQQSQPALRNVSAAQSSARFWQQQLSAQATRILLSVPGNAALAVGVTISVSGCPQGRGDGDYLVTRVRHVYEKKQGFISHIEGQAGGSP